MDTLRLILIFIGIVVLVLIYAFEMRRRQRQGRKQRPEAQRPARREDEPVDLHALEGITARADDDLDQGLPPTPSGARPPVMPIGEPSPMPVTPQPEAPVAARGAEPDTGLAEPKPAPASRPKPTTPAATPPKRTVLKKVPEGMRELIIALHVMAPKESPFTGARLQPALDQAGLRFGDMAIYHCLGAAGYPLFSLASVREPGTFDPARMAGMETPGLALFLRLPGPVRGREAFDRMLDTASLLAAELDGQVRDESRNPLTRHRITQIREQIAEYEYKLEVARKRSDGQ